VLYLIDAGRDIVIIRTQSGIQNHAFAVFGCVKQNFDSSTLFVWRRHQGRRYKLVQRFWVMCEVFGWSSKEGKKGNTQIPWSGV
jgi:hypothetical protein